MGNPDMTGPIAYAFSYPERLDLIRAGVLQRGTSGPVRSGRRDDFLILLTGGVHATIDLAYEACRRGGSYPVVLNAANEVLVDMFLHGAIGFTDIQKTLIRVLDEHEASYRLTLEEILEEDHMADQGSCERDDTDGRSYMTIIYAIIIFCLLIFVHELGHFIAGQGLRREGERVRDRHGRCDIQKAERGNSVFRCKAVPYRRVLRHGRGR